MGGLEHPTAIHGHSAIDQFREPLERQAAILGELLHTRSQYGRLSSLRVEQPRHEPLPVLLDPRLLLVLHQPLNLDRIPAAS